VRCLSSKKMAASFMTRLMEAFDKTMADNGGTSLLVAQEIKDRPDKQEEKGD